MTNQAKPDLLQTALRVAFFIILAGASIWIFAPFLLATIWATTIVIATWPLMLRVQAMLGGRRSWAVAVITIALLMVLVAPFTLGAMALIDHAAQVGGWVESVTTGGLPQPPD